MQPADSKQAEKTSPEQQAIGSKLPNKQDTRDTPDSLYTDVRQPGMRGEERRGEVVLNVTRQWDAGETHEGD